MDSVLKAFHQEISDLRNLLQFYETESRLLDTFTSSPTSKEEHIIFELSEKLKSFRLSKLQFNYNSFVISLYGSFERFIENCITTYIETLNNLITVYLNLPETILKNHFLFSLSLITKIEQPRYSGPLTKEEVIKNLHTCINTHDMYQLNKDAFAQHTANFRLQVVEESFSNIGLLQLSQKILKTKSFQSYCIISLGISPEIDLVPTEAFQILNDLAEYRNQVAHGITCDILTNDILLDYLVFFESFSSALIEVLQENILFRELESNGEELGEITDVYQGGRVVCFKTNYMALKKGDLLVGKNKEFIVKASIKGMKLNDKNIDAVDDKDNYEVGVEIDTNFKKSFKIYLLHARI